MSDSDSRKGDEQQPRIELEHTVPIKTPRHVGMQDTPAAESHVPIPERPLHLCPYCEYNLTGLTRWRCPECGEFFTLAEARAAGFSASKTAVHMRRIGHRDRVISAIGFLLLGFAFIAPCVSTNTVSGKLQIGFTVRSWLVWLVGVPMVVTSILVHLYFGVRWSRLSFVMGLLLAVLCIVLL
jgi:hypothetical protein